MGAKTYYVVRTISGEQKGEYLTEKGCTLDDSGCNCRHRGCALRFESRGEAYAECRDCSETVHRVKVQKVGRLSRRILPYLVFRSAEGGYRTKQGKVTIDLGLAETFDATDNERAVMSTKKKKGDKIVRIVAPEIHGGMNGSSRHIRPEALS